MANKGIFSYARSGKRKIGHSKFDMGFEHIMSSNFGALHPAACFETLPDDYWDISQNTVTLLKPLTAPAMTRINQNFYGVYVRNQQVWKYWNDYISNGTAYGDVYGSNVTNQNLKNVWDVPSIPDMYLQTILKVGVGNAAPVWYMTFKYTGSFATSDPLAFFLSTEIDWRNQSSSPKRITDAVYAAFQISSPSNINNESFLVTLGDSGLKDLAFDVWMKFKSSNEIYYLVSVCSSMRQYLRARSLLKNDVTSDGNFPYSPISGEDLSTSFSKSNYRLSFDVRFFADRCSSEPSSSKSAFIIERSSYVDDNHDTLKSLDYFPRLVSQELVRLRKGANVTTSQGFQSFYSPFWGFRYEFHSDSSNCYVASSDLLNPNFDNSSDFWWRINGSQYGFSGPLDDATPFAQVFVGKCFYLGVTTFDFEDCLDCFGSTISTVSVVDFSDASTHTLIHYRGFDKTFNASQSSLIDGSFRCDLQFQVDIIATSNFSSETVRNVLYSKQSRSIGYDVTSLFTYLCMNSSRFLDDFGIKVDPLCSRPFADYRFELTNALPFFAYSKNWNDNFRNKAVSSPELDFSESNSLIFADSFYYQYVFSTNFKDVAKRPTRYQGKNASDFTANGWSLELCLVPRNGATGNIHTHLPVSSFSIAFSLLTGFNLDAVVYSLTNSELNVNEFYLPSYYNGLLHLKYQNFNKDYFTSALLDPMSGANQVSVGNTINELRENEAKQHWWERTAMYRSIKNWFQGTYGITPIELPLDSRITGTDHTDIQIGEVIQTSASTPESPQGSRTGLGGAHGKGTLCHGHANEHGFILILCSHTVESQYLQVFDKMWDVKDSFLDYPTIDFAGIGNESILQKEVCFTSIPSKRFDVNFQNLAHNASASKYSSTELDSSVSYRGGSNPILMQSKTNGVFNIAQTAGTSLNNVFGFIPRYSSYKFKMDQVSGQYRHELNFWHTFKRYLTQPILCHEFVNWELAADDEDINRIFAVTDDLLDDKFCIDCFINASVDRALPFVCVPSSK